MQERRQQAGIWLAMCMALRMMACATANYTWVDALPPAAMAPEPYRLQASDMLSVLIWNQAKMSVDVRVRSDGQVTLPLIGDVGVAGLTPVGAAQHIEQLLNGLVLDPKVTVTLKETKPSTYSIVGEVKSSGTYPLQGNVTILQAIAASGGLSQYASSDGIYVIRKDPQPQRIRFSYDRLAKAQGRGVLFHLRDGDVVVVE